jgi:CYTH domain-containing protein
MKIGDEFERRWIVLVIDPDIRCAPSIVIEQAYFDARERLRVRIISDAQGQQRAEITTKTGRGICRRESTVDVNLEAARFLVEASFDRIKKRRYSRDGWEVDFFEDALTGLIVAELEMSNPQQEVNLPPWIRSAIEITNIVSNMHLARIACDLSTNR